MTANELSKKQINALLCNTYPKGLPYFIDEEEMEQIAHITHWEMIQKGHNTAYIMGAIRHKWFDFVEKEGRAQYYKNPEDYDQNEQDAKKSQIAGKQPYEMTIAADEGALSLFDSFLEEADEETRQMVSLRWNRKSVSEITSLLQIKRSRFHWKMSNFVKRCRNKVDRMKRCGKI